MPTPGFPDWLCVGAVVRNITTEDQLVVTRIEYQPAVHPEREAGRYAIQLNQLTEDHPPRRLRTGPAVPHWTVINLSQVLDNYVPTGNWLDEWEHLVSAGTTHPVVMAATTLEPMGNIVIQGTDAFDGEYVIQAVTRHTGVRIGIDIELRTPESILEPDGPRMPDAEVEDIYMPNAVDDEREQIADAWPPPGSPEIETGMPRVERDQVWLLPLPNEGLWRTSFEQTGVAGLVMTRDPQVTLRHARERSRVMRCTGTWLIEHGVRQEPPDPRANRPGQQVVVGQIWQFNPDAGTRYRRIPRWRVHAIDEAAGQVCLMAADGSGKRIYLPPTRIIALATYAGDGLPRRTAFEHILDDVDAD